MMEQLLTDAANDESTDELFGTIFPLKFFALHDEGQREAFLCEFCKAGETVLFEAVSHIWASLEGPREARCIAMGMAAGTGGKGKLALVRLLRACLKEVVTWGEPMPRPENYLTLGQWHQATMDAFEAEAAREDQVYKHYAAILNGLAG